MSLFGPPDVEKLKAKRDVHGLFKLMMANRGELSQKARLALIELGPEVVLPLAQEVLTSKGPSFPIGEFVDVVAAVGPPAVPALAAVAGGANLRARYLSTLALGAIGTPDAIPALQSIAQASGGASMILSSLAAGFAKNPAGARVRLPLLSGLQGMFALIGCAGDCAWGQVKDEHKIMIIRSQPVQVWEWMAGAFAIRGDRQATSVLVWKLRDKEPYVRRVASLSLGLMGDPAAVVPLTEKLQDGDPGVRQAASLALGVLQPAASGATAGS
jgi:HEAT repeat protein